MIRDNDTELQHEVVLAERGHRWDRPPAEEHIDGSHVRWRCHGTSDYWRITEGVASKHDGSALLTPMDGDFTVELRVGCEPEELYDQVGLMIVASSIRWLKVGVEMDHGYFLSAVHTREESDWSKEPTSEPTSHLRATRRDSTIEVAVGEDRRIFRTLYLPGPVRVGPYSCAPKGPGFWAAAEYLEVSG